MRKIEIFAYSCKEAIAIAKTEFNINVVRNVTTSFKRQKPIDFDVFITKILTKNHLNEPNQGCIVALEEGISNKLKIGRYIVFSN